MSVSHGRAAVVCVTAEREGKGRWIGWAWAQAFLLDEEKKLAWYGFRLYRKAVGKSSGTA